MTLEVIMQLVDELTPEQRKLLAAYLENPPLPIIEPMPAEAPSRVFNMHPGAFQFGDDFDDPLPEEFWLGDDV